MVISFLELVINQKSETEDHPSAAGTPKAFGVRWADFGLRLRAGLAVSNRCGISPVSSQWIGYEPSADSNRD
jgi:hypothetical protein